MTVGCRGLAFTHFSEAIDLNVYPPSLQLRDFSHLFSSSSLILLWTWNLVVFPMLVLNSYIQVILMLALIPHRFVSIVLDGRLSPFPVSRNFSPAMYTGE